MPFTLHYNVIAEFWFEGNAEIPPERDPDISGYVQTLKPYVAYNGDQQAAFGYYFFRVITPADWYPKDPFTDPNGIGSTIKFPSADGGYFCKVMGTVPLYSEGDLIGWQCVLQRVYNT